MKKAKFMLIAIAVLASVSGTLVFKEQKEFLDIYCIKTTIDNSAKLCNAQTVFRRPAEIGEPCQTFYYTTQKAGGGHVEILADCPSTACPSACLGNE